MKFKLFASAVVALAMSALGASAAVVTQGSTGSTGTGGFTLTGGSGVIVDVAPHPAWVNTPTTPVSNWVWDSANTSFTPLTFSYSFNMSGFNALTAVLSGVWAHDNVGVAQLNGVNLAPPTATYNAYSALSSGSGLFNAGVNTLTFAITDLGLPGGFRAAFTVTADEMPAVPLPATLPLLIGGLGFVGFFGRRRKVA